MALSPWYKVVYPREDLRAGRPLDASEFAVHLDYVREGRAPVDYQEPARFFERTYLTQNLLDLAAQVTRRLSGIKVGTSAVFNMATQFGGGKTHALTLLYHLALAGPKAAEWAGVPAILKKAEVKRVPQAAVAVFVGQQFDPRGGDDGTPRRQTPWGEIAFQLGGADAFAVVEECDREGRAPGGDTIQRFLPADRPALILIDELMNYVNRWRKSGLADQFYSFLQNLSEAARGNDRVVLAVSVPASVLEMGSDDYADYERFKKMLDRLGKAVIMAAESETSEIIRRRLFEWGGLPPEGRRVAAEYAAWLQDHRYQVPAWFPIDHAVEAFEATYPFHPMALSVFERKWQALPRFQQTRGVLRMLALWVSRAYQQGYKGAHRDMLIGLGTAPLDDPLFRQAVFEQLGGTGLEGAVTTDIGGKRDAHAVRLDEEATEAIRKARLHQKVATAIFFESNGGVVTVQADATLPELRLAVAEPDLDVGNVETVLETLGETCYFLVSEKNRYRFSLRPNLNKILADRRATIKTPQVRDRVRAEIQSVFKEGPRIERVYFPEKSADIPNQAALTLIILSPENTADDPQTRQLVDVMTREHGTSGRTFKSALIWAVPENAAQLLDEARKLLAWEDIDSEGDRLGLDPSQYKQLREALQRAQRDLRETVWRTYKKVLLLGKAGDWREVDLGLVHSSAANSLVDLILGRLRQDDEVTEGVSPYTLLRNWPAMTAWSTKAVRDAFFASPQLPRLLNAESLRRTIADGVEQGLLAYVGPAGPDGRYFPIVFQQPLAPASIEFSDGMFVLQAKDVPPPEPYVIPADQARPIHDQAQPVELTPTPPPTPTVVHPPLLPTGGLRWEGTVPPQKWVNFYTRVLASFATQKGLKLTVRVEVSEGVTPQKVAETRVALRELGLDESGLQTVDDSS